MLLVQLTSVWGCVVCWLVGTKRDPNAGHIEATEKFIINVSKAGHIFFTLKISLFCAGHVRAAVRRWPHGWHGAGTGTSAAEDRHSLWAARG